ncbi:hypothetical protein C8R45DRAFT_921591 [Mycena sanguinolenta]|nr:hypothetical protein C8R45DRAFT_921591 [Mycena sanguinolenta]
MHKGYTKAAFVPLKSFWAPVRFFCLAFLLKVAFLGLPGCSLGATGSFAGFQHFADRRAPGTGFQCTFGWQCTLAFSRPSDASPPTFRSKSVEIINSNFAPLIWRAKIHQPKWQRDRPAGKSVALTRDRLARVCTRGVKEHPAPSTPNLARNVRGYACFFESSAVHALIDLTPSNALQLHEDGAARRVFLAYSQSRARSANADVSSHLHSGQRRLLQPRSPSDSFLGRYRQSQTIRELQRQTETIISGSTALQFFNRLTWSNSDLDSKDASAQLLNDGPKDYHGRGIADVLDFYNESKKIQVIIVVTVSPTEVIAGFHSTCVMNVIAYDKVYALYPWSTFVEKEALTVKSTWRQETAGREAAREVPAPHVEGDRISISEPQMRWCQNESLSWRPFHMGHFPPPHPALVQTNGA